MLLFLLIYLIFLPIKLDVFYLIVSTTTIFDTGTLLVISLAITRFVHLKNLKFLENQEDKNKQEIIFKEKIKLLQSKVNYDKKLSLFIAIFFGFLTIIQPLVLIFTINKIDLNSNNIINIINLEFESQKKILII